MELGPCELQYPNKRIKRDERREYMLLICIDLATQVMECMLNVE